MRFLRTNTAIRLTVGPFLDKTDGVTPETAITVTSCKLTLMVDDGNVPTLVLDAAPTASGGANDMVHVTGDDAGFYDLELAAANVNYVGRAMLAITDAAVHCPVFHEFMILPAKIYDSLVLGTDNIEADTVQWLGAAAATPTTAGVPEVDVTHWNGTAIPGVDTAGYPKVTVKDGTGTGEINTNAGAVALVDLVTTTTTLTNAPSDSSGVTTLLTRLSAARAGYLDNLSAGAAALEASVTSVLSKLLKYTQLILRKDSAIAIDNATEVTAINANGGSGGGAFANTTDSQEALRDRGDAAWITATGFAVAGDAMALTSGERSTLVAAIWDKATSALSTAGSIGKLLVDNINATISSRSSHSAADVWSAVTRTLTAATNITSTGGTTVPQTGDSYARLGAPAGASVSADVAAVKAQTAAIETDTQDLQSRTPAALTAGGNMKSDLLALSGDTTAADRMEAFMDGAITGAAGPSATTTSLPNCTGFTEATNDHFNGRLITFTSGVLLGQQTDITDYVGSSQTFTVTALTEAPAEGDTFIIS